MLYDAADKQILSMLENIHRGAHLLITSAYKSSHTNWSELSTPIITFDDTEDLCLNIPDEKCLNISVTL